MYLLPERSDGLARRGFIVIRDGEQGGLRPLGPLSDLITGHLSSGCGGLCRDPSQGPSPPEWASQTGAGASPWLGSQYSATSSAPQHPWGLSTSVFMQNKSRFLWKTNVHMNCRSTFAISKLHVLVFIVSFWGCIVDSCYEAWSCSVKLPLGLASAFPKDGFVK